MSDPGIVPTPAPAPASVPPPAPAASWYDGLKNEAEFVGTVQTRGLDKKDAATAAFEFYKAHKEAEKFIGAPAKELLRLPKEPGDPAWNQIYERLGKPAKADEYDFKDIKFKDGTALPDTDAAFYRDVAFKANMSKDAARQFAADMMARDETTKEQTAVIGAADLKAEKDALMKDWGANKDGNLFIARQAAIKLGFKPEAIDALQKVAGYGATMQALLNVGQKIGEDKFIANQAPNATGVLTVQQAKAKLEELKRDTLWRDKYYKGDRAAIAEFDALVEMSVGPKPGV